MAYEWTVESAKVELMRLVGLCDQLKNAHRSSVEHRRWLANALSFLEEVFGRDSNYFKVLGSFNWSASEAYIDLDDYGAGTSVNTMLEQKHQQAYSEQMARSKGWLQAAGDELDRKGIVGVYRGKNSPPEASDIVRVITLVERRLRKAIKGTPGSEAAIKDVFENLLIGAEIPYTREKDRFEYSTKTYTTDFILRKLDLAMDFKWCGRKERVNDIIQELNDYILAFRSKFGNAFFVVYDCGFIADIEQFVSSFAAHDGVIVRVVKH